MAAAFEALLDAGDTRLDEMCAMNARVRTRLIEVITDMRHAVDSGDHEVMRSALINTRITIGSLIDEGDDDVPKLIVKWAGKV